jgi:2-polyprenyl-6-hydroxyphenyl methylase/3-demethylubiquinone-9 3-methyltransferase
MSTQRLKSGSQDLEQASPDSDRSQRRVEATEPSAWNHANDSRFVRYYEQLSVEPRNLERFASIQKVLLRVLGPEKSAQVLDVADIGCNTGMQCHLWAKSGHRVYGLDISEPLLETARKRADEAGLAITFQLGSATELPWPDESMDVCIAPGLLEHVSDWKKCVQEFARVVRPGGILYLTTTNVLCPWQEEFNLPLYSWYPAPAKRYCERLAVTSHPHLVNYASYPAVHWFSFYGLRNHLKTLGFSCIDRFDLVDIQEKRAAVRFAVRAIRASRFVRLLAHMTQGGTLLVAVKQP